MKYKEPYVYQALAEMYAEDGKMQEAFDVIAAGVARPTIRMMRP